MIAAKGKGSLRRYSSGFNLIELMVGVALALIGTIVIMQVLLSSQNNKKSAVSGGDAQQNGAMALHDIADSMIGAGYAFTSALNGASGSCDATGSGELEKVTGYNAEGSAGSDVSFWLAPVVIKEGGDDSDEITILQGDTSISVSSTDIALSASDKLTVASGTAFNFNLGDVVLVYQAGKGCVFSQVTAKDANNILDVTPGGVYLSPYSNENETSPYNSAGSLDGFTDGSKVLNVGPTPRVSVYSVKNNALSVDGSSVFIGDSYKASEGIVSMQAKYGVDTSGDGAIDSYVDAPANNIPFGDYNSDGVINQLDVLRVRAIRVAILAVGTHKNSTCDAKQQKWSGGDFDMTAIPDWQCYDYRVFETVMPIRNVIWDAT